MATLYVPMPKYATILAQNVFWSQLLCEYQALQIMLTTLKYPYSCAKSSRSGGTLQQQSWTLQWYITRNINNGAKCYINANGNNSYH